MGALYEVHYASKTLISLGMWGCGNVGMWDCGNVGMCHKRGTSILAACRVRREGWEECFAVFGSFQWLEPCLVLGL